MGSQLEGDSEFHALYKSKAVSVNEIPPNPSLEKGDRGVFCRAFLQQKITAAYLLYK